MMIWKKSLERPLLCLCAVHTSSVSHSQFDKHLIMFRISRWHPPCRWKCTLQKINPFATRSAMQSEATLTLHHIHHVIRSLSQTTRQTQLRTSLSKSRGACPYPNPEVHIEDIGRTVHIYFLSANKISVLTNRKSTSLCQSTIPHSTNIYLFCWSACPVK